MARLNFSRDSVRPIHPAQDPATQEAHTKTLPSWLLRLSQSTRDKPIELWWQDEARVRQQGRLTRLRGFDPRKSNFGLEASGEVFDLGGISS